MADWDAREIQTIMFGDKKPADVTASSKNNKEREDWSVAVFAALCAPKNPLSSRRGWRVIRG